MQLPKLNTEGNDVTNTVMAIKKMHAVDAATEGQKKQNALADLQLSPENQAFIKAMKNAQLANAVAKNTRDNLENSKIAAGMVYDQLGTAARQVDIGKGQGYKEWYDKITSNPMLKDHVGMLPKPEDYLQPDFSNDSGRSINEVGRKEIKQVLSNLMSAAERKAQGLEVGYKMVYLPSGKSYMIAIKPPTEEGKVLSAEDATGIEGASWDKYPEKKETKVQTRTVKKDVNGKTMEVAQTFVDGKWVDDASGSAYSPKASETGSGARSKVKTVFQNTNGEPVVFMDDGTTRIYKDGKYREATEEEQLNLKKVEVPESVMDKIITELVATNAGIDISKYVKKPKEPVAPEETTPMENPTEEQVKAMKPGTKFIVGGKTYVRN